VNKTDRFESADMGAFEAEAKVGLLATVSPEGLPHISLIASMQAKDPTQLIWGQFSEGRSKVHVKENPHVGFLIMTLDRNLWRGKALWTHVETEGEDYEMYNQKPMFRYNAYFGIHTVHFMDLVETYGKEGLPLARIVMASLATKAAKDGAKFPEDERILKPWAEGLFNRLDTLKFIGYVDEEGFPTIVPVIQCQAAGSRRLADGRRPGERDLPGLRSGATPAARRHRAGVGLQFHAPHPRADLSSRGTQARRQLLARIRIPEVWKSPFKQ